MRYTRQTMLPTQVKSQARRRAEMEAERRQEEADRIARAWAPDFEGQEKFGDDR